MFVRESLEILLRSYQLTILGNNLLEYLVFRLNRLVRTLKFSFQSSLLE